MINNAGVVFAGVLVKCLRRLWPRRYTHDPSILVVLAFVVLSKLLGRIQPHSTLMRETRSNPVQISRAR
jgi:hypothetical protein